jgi:hypothetical protein
MSTERNVNDDVNMMMSLLCDSWVP